jgi:hypothetical protein
MTRGRALTALVALAGLAAGLRLYHLTATSLWNDEGGTLVATSGAGLRAVASSLAHTIQGDHFQPLYFLLLYVWRAVAGSSVFSLRVPSVVFGLAAIAVLGWVARRTFGRAHALIAVALLSVSAFFIAHAQEARPYALLMFLTALLLTLFLQVREQRLERRYPPLLWAFWVCFAVAALGSILVALFAAGLALGDAVVDRRPRVWLRTWLPCAVAALPAVAFGLLSSVATNPTEAQVTQLSGSLLRNAVFAVYGIVAGTTYGPPVEALHGGGAMTVVLHYWPSLAILAAVTAIAALAAIRTMRSDVLSREQRDVANILLVTLLGSYALMFGFALLTHLNWQPRHSFFLALPLFLLLPLAARGSQNPRGSLWRSAGIVALVLLAAANVYSLGRYYFDSACARDDYRGVAYYVIRDNRPGESSVLLNGYLGLLRYYGDRTTVEGGDLPQQGFAAAVQRRTRAAPSVLLLSNREWFFWKGTATIPEAMRPLYRFEGTRTYTYFTVYRFTLLRQPE